MNERTARHVRNIGTAALLLVAAGLLAASAHRAREDGSGTSDFDDFWRTARNDVLARRTISEQYGVHNYLPFFMAVMAPLGWLPLKAAVVVFNVASMAAFRAAVRVTSRWVGWRAAGLTAGLVFAYAADCVLLGQTALIIVALLVWGLRLFEKRRDWAAGTVLAVAASVKLFPIVLVGWFLLKRRFRVVGGVVIGLVVCDVMVPSAVFGPRQNWELHRAFWERSAAGQSVLALAAGDSDKMAFSNQSLPVVMRRLLLPVDAGRHYDGKGFRVNIVDWDGRECRVLGLRMTAVQAAVVGVLGVLTCVVVLGTRRAAAGLGNERMRFEYAAWMVLSMVMSPVLWTFYYSLCFLPLALMASDAFERRRTSGRWPMMTMVLLAWGVATPLLAWPEARAIGIHYWGLVLVLLTILSLARRAGRRLSEV